MTSLTDKLAVLIEAYAAAKSSNNGLLLEFAASELNSFLKTVEIHPASQEEPPAVSE